jgi:hypothetical protein
MIFEDIVISDRTLGIAAPLAFNFNFFKGKCHEIFDPWFFFIKQLPLGPWYTFWSLFAYGLEFAKIFDLEISNFGLSCVNDTAEAKKDP